MTEAFHTPRPSAEVEHFLAEAISNSPQPLKDLALLLSSALSEDDWKTADRLLLALALRTQGPDGWRPIETAPKDGETVLIFTPRTFPQVTAASYRDDCAAEHWASVGHRWHFPGDVAHWMPLPAAPALRPQTAESGK